MAGGTAGNQTLQAAQADPPLAFPAGSPVFRLLCDGTHSLTSQLACKRTKPEVPVKRNHAWLQRWPARHATAHQVCDSSSLVLKSGDTERLAAMERAATSSLRSC
jgi:hypothetical protein